jgi:hypothetical protein
VTVVRTGAHGRGLGAVVDTGAARSD